MLERSESTLLFQEAELKLLDTKINALLPPQYQCYDSVRSTSMGSAKLKFDAEGRVAWDEIWTTYCDLALAGGPPHRGTFLEDVPVEECLQEPDNYRMAAEEIARGIELVTGLTAGPAEAPGWVSVVCVSDEMATWLMRAIIAENVMACRKGTNLQVPAGPRFRLEKEVKNVVTAVAKAHHYWAYHRPPGQWVRSVPLLQPALAATVRADPAAHQLVVKEIEEGIRRTTGMTTVSDVPPGWVGVPCADDRMAVWLLRAVLVENVLARRQEQILFLPAGPRCSEGDVARVATVLQSALRLWSIYLEVNGKAASSPPLPQ